MVQTIVRDGELLSRFKQHIQKSTYSQAAIAQRVGTSATAISKYLHGSYEGNREKLETKIHSYLLREDERNQRIVLSHVELSITQRITDALRLAHQDKSIAVVCGPAGIGKTYALRYYQRMNPQTHIIDIDPSYSKTHLIRSTADMLKISTQGNTARISERIITHLRDSDTLLCYDEADYLSDSSLEWIRRVIHDKAGCGLILCGLDRLEHIIRTHKGDHDQLRSRVSVLCGMVHAKEHDITLLSDSVWNTLDAETEQALVHSAKGSIRRTVKIIENTHRVVQDRPSAQDIKRAAALLM